MESKFSDRAKQIAEAFTFDELFRMLWKARVKFLGAALLVTVPTALVTGFIVHILFDWIGLPFNVSVPIVLTLAVLVPTLLIVWVARLQSGREADELAEALFIRISRDMRETEDVAREGN